MTKMKVTVKLGIVSCEKCRTHARVVAADFAPEYIGIEGEHKDLLVVVGEFDSIKLVKKLRKKMCCGADLLKQEEVKPEKEKEKEKEKEEKEKWCPCGASMCFCSCPQPYCPQYPPVINVVCHSEESPCTIM